MKEGREVGKEKRRLQKRAKKLIDTNSVTVFCCSIRSYQPLKYSSTKISTSLTVILSYLAVELYQPALKRIISQAL